MTENSLHVSQRNKRTLEDEKKSMGSLRKEENNLWKRMKSVYRPIKLWSSESCTSLFLYCTFIKM